MAGASMNDIKARMKSVESTMQITKAMELVATSKLRGAKEKVEKSRSYYEVLRNVIDTVMSCAEIKDTPITTKREGGRSLFIVIAGDRGLAGGYNSNIFKTAEQISKSKDAVFLPIGKKAIEYFTHRKRELFSDVMSLTAEVGVGSTMRASAQICESYFSGDFCEIYLVYTKFLSMLTQLPVCEELLPLKKKENGEADNGFDPIIEEEPEELLMRIMPEYIGGVIYSAVSEALASESAARRSAMNAANKNAGEMIDMLMLKYNRARQAVITQEITEIVSGAEAL